MYKYVSTFTIEHQKEISIEHPILANTLLTCVEKSLEDVLSYYEKFESLEDFKESILPIIHTHYCSECSVNNIVFQIYLFNFNNEFIETASIDDVLNIIYNNCERIYNKHKLHEK